MNIICQGILFRSRLCTLGTHYHPTLDPAVLWTPSNDTSRPICPYSLNLMPPALLYLRTLWRYTNAVIIIIIQNTEP